MSERHGAVAVIRVGVFGAGGRMGSTVCAGGRRRSRARARGRGRPYHAGIDLRQLGVEARGINVAPNTDALLDAGAEVAVDFTVHRRRAREPRVVCRATACTRSSAPAGSTADELERVRGAASSTRRNCGDRAQLRDRRGADDALRRARGAVLRDRRDHRAAPRPEDRRAVGHGDATARADGGGVRRLGARSHHQGRHRRGARRRGRGRASRSTRCDCAGSSPTRRCCSAPPARRLSIRHDTYDRTSFMPGVLLAVKAIADARASPSGSTCCSASR